MTHSLQKEKSRAAQTFLLTLGLATLMFLPFVIYNRGYFIYYGDFNAQQIPFYQLAHDAVRSGNIGWNWYTDLGANFVGSYSFYLLGSPFFWLTLPFPNAWVPYMMAPLLALKIGLCGWTGYLYIRRFVKPRMAMIAGILYAFSGFSLYNIFFNHFHEAMIWFPLMLLGLEQYMTEGRRGLLAVSVFFSALSNYYFFIGQAVFLMAYWIVRALSGEWEHRLRRFFGVWLEALLGTVCAAAILLPSFLAVTQNSRVEQPLEGWGLLLFSTEQRLYDILRSFIFPPDLPARAFFLPDSNNKWASMTAWMPVFGCTGVLAYFQSRHHTDWLRRMLVITLLCAVIPGLNALFQMGNQMYYARWYYMMVLLLILATVKCFNDEDSPVEWKRPIGWNVAITVVFSLYVTLCPASWTPDEETGEITFGLVKEPAYVWMYAGITLICLALTGLLVREWRTNRTAFVTRCTAVCAAVSVAFGMCYITMGKFITNYPDDYVIDKLIQNAPFSLADDDTFYRTDMHLGMDNQGMYWKLPTIQAFHSIVPGSVMEYYESIGVPRSVGSRPESSHYGLRGLLSVRYLFDYAQQPGDVQLYGKKADDFFMVSGDPAMPGWEYYGTQNRFYIYENQYYVPMGFTYDGYILRSEYEDLSEYAREMVMLRALVLEDEDAATTPLPHLDVHSMWFNETSYYEDCLARTATAAKTFERDNNGFSAVITTDTDQTVFFSVPYEDGWSATVNGKSAAILKANVGFMAVNCPAGQEVTIRFQYRTPGLRLGVMLSVAGLLLLALYLLCNIRHNRRLVPTPAAPTPGPIADVPAEKPLPAGGPDDEEFNLYKLYQPPKADTHKTQE